MRIMLALLTTLVVVTASTAQQPSALPEGFKVTPVLKATETASKMKLAYPVTAKPEVVSVIGELAPGGRTARHMHPVPVFVYVLEGAVVVQADGGEPREYSAGQAFVEDLNHWHQAFNRTGAPAKILVVFMAEEGKPTTITAQ